MNVYLDNGATTMVDPKVAEVILDYMTRKFGNASSLHEHGRDSREALERSRKIIANKIGAHSGEIVFTSSGTESDNLAIKGIAYANKGKGNHIITSKIEHPAVMRSCEALEKEGFKVTYVGVDNEGFIDMEALKNAITGRTILISVMHANNEIGTIEDIEAIGRLARKHGIYFHTDAVQSLMKTPLNAKHIDLISLAAHKIHGPKGVGALYVKRGTNISALMHGGPQENKLRAGTENIPGIAGFAKAAELYSSSDVKRMEKLRDMLINSLLQIEGTRLNGPRDRRLCNNVNISFKNVEGESIGMLLNAKGICTSTGSACASRSLKPSHVLLAIGLAPEDAHGSVRLTLGRFNTEEEINYVLEVFPDIIRKLRKISPFK